MLMLATLLLGQYHFLPRSTRDQRGFNVQTNVSATLLFTSFYLYYSYYSVTYCSFFLLSTCDNMVFNGNASPRPKP